MNPYADPQEEAELATMCLSRLYEQNFEIFDALVCALYAWFRDDVEPQAKDPYELFASVLATGMKDAPSQRSIETKRLSFAIWDHLKARGIVHGVLQDRHTEQTKILFQAFARFVTVRAFRRGMDLSPKGALRARRILVETEQGIRNMASVVTFRNPFGSGPDC